MWLGGVIPGMDGRKGAHQLMVVLQPETFTDDRELLVQRVAPDPAQTGNAFPGRMKQEIGEDPEMAFTQRGQSARSQGDQECPEGTPSHLDMLTMGNVPGHQEGSMTQFLIA